MEKGINNQGKVEGITKVLNEFKKLGGGYVTEHQIIDFTRFLKENELTDKEIVMVDYFHMTKGIYWIDPIINSEVGSEVLVLKDKFGDRYRTVTGSFNNNKEPFIAYQEIDGTSFIFSHLCIDEDDIKKTICKQDLIKKLNLIGIQYEDISNELKNSLMDAMLKVYACLNYNLVSIDTIEEFSKHLVCVKKEYKDDTNYYKLMRTPNYFISNLQIINLESADKEGEVQIEEIKSFLNENLNYTILSSNYDYDSEKSNIGVRESNSIYFYLGETKKNKSVEVSKENEEFLNLAERRFIKKSIVIKQLKNRGYNTLTNAQLKKCGDFLVEKEYLDREIKVVDCFGNTIEEAFIDNPFYLSDKVYSGNENEEPLNTFTVLEEGNHSKIVIQEYSKYILIICKINVEIPNITREVNAKKLEVFTSTRRFPFADCLAEKVLEVIADLPIYSRIEIVCLDNTSMGYRKPLLNIREHKEDIEGGFLLEIETPKKIAVFDTDKPCNTECLAKIINLDEKELIDEFLSGYQDYVYISTIEKTVTLQDVQFVKEQVTRIYTYCCMPF